MTQSFLNTGDGQTDIPLYAGYLPPSAIREMQVPRTIVTIYTYLFFAETGLFTILAHYTPHEKSEPFRAAKHEYADSFLAALKPFSNFSLYQNRIGYLRMGRSGNRPRHLPSNVRQHSRRPPGHRILRNIQSRSTAGP